MFIQNDLKLIPLEWEHLEYIKKWQNDYNISKNTTLDIIVLRNEKEEEEWFKNQIKLSNKRTFIVTVNNKVIGFVAYSSLNFKNGTAELSIVIGEEGYRGKGIAKRAIKCIETYLQSELNIRKIKAKVLAFNNDSIQLFNSLGYEKEAVLVKEIYRGGKYNDLYIYTKFLKEI